MQDNMHFAHPNSRSKPRNYREMAGGAFAENSTRTKVNMVEMNVNAGVCSLPAFDRRGDFPCQVNKVLKRWRKKC